jgi:hypothetical protein
LGGEIVEVVVVVEEKGEGDALREVGSGVGCLESISMMAMILLIFRLRSRLWLYRMKRENGSPAWFAPQGGERALCSGGRLRQRSR